MKTILILGANGGTAQILIQRLLNETDDELILFLRHASRLAQYQDNGRVTVIDGDVLDQDRLRQAMQKADIVYSNVGGADLAAQTQSILKAMAAENKQRLIFISALGANYEVKGNFGSWNEQAIAAYLPGFRESDKLIQDSGVNYTEIRPAWLTDEDEIDYETTQRGENFKGTEVSRKSVADLAFKLINNPDMDQRASVGVNKPSTDGDKPRWIE
ncbi:SDR family oxidoreductase [Furfurilactobacillus rossiae]|uniref:Nad-dependent epimerase dehydratase n=1 Tax=Furfurilactobacillus rossiae DSM 15814 TaxID=1114972 RepID=A0A0R1R9W8_9LACO|nr:SDR family oxidoreductase [Furfurilactobacillus rossiae]KRL53481.1 nad-dependent epimerase dehydratase [Furfurilactobacillus rossiae DSM 15814]QFR67616.1 NAD(P)H-binding protein [Furfurilactobacillus rossiae]QLE60575.1 oxidoreductase putative [Furfurilactobacillus rossiae]